MEIKKYPDGTSCVIEDDFLPEVVFRINNYTDLWHLNQYVEVCNYNGYEPTIIIPNLIDGQAYRRFDTNQSSGLELVCNFLNSMKAKFKIFHPHNPEVVEALLDNVAIIDNTNFINDVLDEIYSDNLILMSPDAGGFKSLTKILPKLDWSGDVQSAVKSRVFNGFESVLTTQIECKDFEGKDILVIDDICVYGGTFKNIANLLKDRNCGNVYLAVSHMTVQVVEDPVTNYFKKVFTTNSKYDEYFYAPQLGYKKSIPSDKLKVQNAVLCPHILK